MLLRNLLRDTQYIASNFKRKEQENSVPFFEYLHEPKSDSGKQVKNFLADIHAKYEPSKQLETYLEPVYKVYNSLIEVDNAMSNVMTVLKNLKTEIEMLRMGVRS